MGNSVLDPLDFEDEIGEALLYISGYSSCDKFSVLVEGPDDVIVYEKFFSKDKVEVYCMSGCGKLLDVVSSLNGKGYEDSFVAIKDADYDRLNRKTYPYSNLFLTDAHDLETTIIDGEILENIMKENLKYEDLKKRHIVLDGNQKLHDVCVFLKPVSFVRWYNDVNSCHIDFKNSVIPVMLDEGKKLSYESCLNQLKSYSGNELLAVTEADMLNFEHQHSGIACDLQLVRGHDMCEAICYMIRNFVVDGVSYFKKSNLNAKMIEASLRYSYSRDKFSETNLYVSLKDWFCHHRCLDMMAC